MSLEDAVKGGKHEPYALADAVKNIIGKMKYVYLQLQINQTDLLAGTPQFTLSPVAGKIVELKSVVQAAVTTGGDLTVEVNTVAVDGLTVTVADAAAAGDVDTDAPTTDHATAVVSANDVIEIIPSAGFATAGALNVILVIELTDGV